VLGAQHATPRFTEHQPHPRAVEQYHDDPCISFDAALPVIIHIHYIHVKKVDKSQRFTRKSLKTIIESRSPNSGNEIKRFNIEDYTL